MEIHINHEHYDNFITVEYLYEPVYPKRKPIILTSELIPTSKLQLTIMALYIFLQITRAYKWGMFRVVKNLNEI